VTRGVRDDEEVHGCRATIDRLVVYAWRDLEPRPRRQQVQCPRDLERQFAAEHKKELSCLRMTVPYLIGVGRHALLDDAQIGGAHEVPAVALRAPDVVVGRCRGNRCVQRSCPQRRKVCGYLTPGVQLQRL